MGKLALISFTIITYCRNIWGHMRMVLGGWLLVQPIYLCWKQHIFYSLYENIIYSYLQSHTRGNHSLFCSSHLNLLVTDGRNEGITCRKSVNNFYFYFWKLLLFYFINLIFLGSVLLGLCWWNLISFISRITFHFVSSSNYK